MWFSILFFSYCLNSVASFSMSAEKGFSKELSNMSDNLNDASKYTNQQMPTRDQGSISRANATLYTLCRNNELYELLDTIIDYEYRFNKNYHYDWVFLNDEPFTEEFITFVTNAVSGKARFGLIDEESWSIPESVDQNLMKHNIDVMLNDPDGSPPYADSISYRHMCRYESGFFYNHEILLEYDYFWRVEPGVRIYCDIDYDIFKYMIDNEFQYGFTISMLEYPKTIPSLFGAFKSVLIKNNMLNDLFDSNNYSKFIFDPNSLSYNLCHFWTNFEIGNLNMFRSKEYNDLFEELDKYNGFYYERWGDAPVRSLILSVILKKGQIKRFNEIGYEHSPYMQCPQDIETRLKNRCSCNKLLDITNKWYSCSWYFDEIDKFKMIRL